jgi:hypothetical protein
MSHIFVFFRRLDMFIPLIACPAFVPYDLMLKALLHSAGVTPYDVIVIYFHIRIRFSHIR